MLRPRSKSPQLWPGLIGVEWLWTWVKRLPIGRVLPVVQLLFLRLLLGVQNHPETMSFHRSV